jgi:tetratricopeptide (TPR) repeat protein
MPNPQQLTPHLVAELTARGSWKKRNYGDAFAQAGNAAELALQSGDELSWWNMKHLQAECLRDQGLIEECLELARFLAEHPLTATSPDLGARAYTVLAVSLQGLGRLQEAAQAASTAGSFVAGNAKFVNLHVQAQQALIAALAEGRLLDEAWRECMVLESLLTQYVDDDTAGKAYWVIGNVAFLSNRVTEGSTFHDVAAERLAPSKDVDLWARFNRASAEMRLQAKLGDAATLRCIERAELATDIAGANDRERLEMLQVRAHWHYLTGDMDAAIKILEPVCARASILAKQTAAEAHFLLGRALAAKGLAEESRRHLEEAATLFDKAAASERSATVREYLGNAYGQNLQGE